MQLLHHICLFGLYFLLVMGIVNVFVTIVIICTAVQVKAPVGPSREELLRQRAQVDDEHVQPTLQPQQQQHQQQQTQQASEVCDDAEIDLDHRSFVG